VGAILEYFKMCFRDGANQADKLKEKKIKKKEDKKNE